MVDKSNLNDPTQATPTQGVPQTKSEAIRLALRELGDVDASAAAVKALIFERWPTSNVKVEVEADKNWSQIVSMNRKRAADEFGLASMKAKANSDPSTSFITRDEIVLIKSMIDLCDGDVGRLKKILCLRDQLGFEPRLVRIINDWLGVMEPPQEGL